MAEREWLARLESFGIKLGLDTIGATAALGIPSAHIPSSTSRARTARDPSPR